MSSGVSKLFGTEERACTRWLWELWKGWTFTRSECARTFHFLFWKRSGKKELVFWSMPWNESTTAEMSQPQAQPIATNNWPAIDIVILWGLWRPWEICCPAWRGPRDRQISDRGIALLTCISAVLCLACTWHEGKEQSNARLKEGKNGFICIKRSRLGFPVRETSQSRDMWEKFGSAWLSRKKKGKLLG